MINGPGSYSKRPYGPAWIISLGQNLKKNKQTNKQTKNNNKKKNRNRNKTKTKTKTKHKQKQRQNNQLPPCFFPLIFGETNNINIGSVSHKAKETSKYSG